MTPCTISRSRLVLLLFPPAMVWDARNSRLYMPCNMSHAILVAATARRTAVATTDLNSCKWYKHPENLKNYKTASTSIKRCTQLSAYVIGLCLHF